MADQLRAERRICARNSAGFYGTIDPEIDTGDVWGLVAEISDELNSELAHEAIAILNQAGWKTMLNEIDLITVSIESTE